MCVPVSAATLDAIGKALEPEGFNFRTISAKMNTNQRGKALEEFMHDPPTTIFLLNHQIAAVGLTLVAASHMFLVSEEDTCVPT